MITVLLSIISMVILLYLVVTREDGLAGAGMGTKVGVTIGEGISVRFPSDPAQRKNNTTLSHRAKNVTLTTQNPTTTRSLHTTQK